MEETHSAPEIAMDTLIGSPAKAPLPAEAHEKKVIRVLVMDDETPILDLTARLLKMKGFEVATAQCGQSAVTQYCAAHEAGNTFDVVILDLTVPERMGGFEAFQKMQAFDPKVKAIISSGYANEDIVVNYRNYGIAAIAPKPYRIRELLDAVEAAAQA